jgi:hypothetical protein
MDAKRAELAPHLLREWRAGCRRHCRRSFQTYTFIHVASELTFILHSARLLPGRLGKAAGGASLGAVPVKGPTCRQSK